MNHTIIAGRGLLLATVWALTGASAEAPDDPAALPGTSPAQAVPMTTERIGELILRIDPDARHQGSLWEFVIDEHTVAVIYDEGADRIRAVVPVRESDDLGEDELLRLLQANFDSALDARYAIARDVLWAVFIHPLSPLTDEQFLVGLGQTINLVATFGTSYSSGMFVFGGGDSAALQRRELIERLRELGTRI